jgi:hypothetical protein
MALLRGEVGSLGSLFFYLEYKHVTLINTCVRHRLRCGLFFDAAAASVEALIIAVDQTVKALDVK